MAIRRTTKTVLAAAAALALLPGLAACGAGGQSVADACELITSGTSDMNSSMSELSTAMTSGDTEALSEQVSAINDEVAAIGEKVTNEEVAPVYEKFAGAFGDLTTQIEGMGELDMTDTEAMTKVSEDMTAASTALTEAQSELPELCGA